MKKLFLTVFVLLFVADCFAGSYGIGLRDRDGFVPQPRLLEPTKDTVDISGKETLAFSWSPHEQARGFRSYFDFRLYKGYDMLESTRLIKKEIDPQTYHVDLPSSMFEDGQIYTWSLRQVYDPIRKSDRSCSSFRVIKRQPA